MTAYLIGLIGMGVFCDGVASLWQYTRPERNHNQSWMADHSLRILRMAYGVALMILGGMLI